MKQLTVMMVLVLAFFSMGVSECESNDSQEAKQTKAVQRQQSQYAKAQPVPGYNFSLERDLLIQLYNIRNQQLATHTVWRSRNGTIEYDCPSMGYGLPYDTSLTNPFMATDEDQTGFRSQALTSIGQAEPNGVYASTNTSATWVMCIGPSGGLEPHYVETFVTTFPYPIKVDYETNRIIPAGKSTISIKVSKP